MKRRGKDRCRRVVSSRGTLERKVVFFGGALFWDLLVGLDGDWTTDDGPVGRRLLGRGRSLGQTGLDLRVAQVRQIQFAVVVLALIETIVC